MIGGRTAFAGSPGTALPKGPQASGGLEDAKFYEYATTVPANATVVQGVDATSFYVDRCSSVAGQIQFSVDDCFPFVNIKLGAFVRLRRFRRLHLKNTTGAPIDVHLIYTVNPDFLVIQANI